MANKCKKCVRYNPKGLSNCRKQQSVYNLENRLKVKLDVVKCGEYLAPEKVFKTPKSKPKPQVAVEPNLVVCPCEGECECEG
jgi:hypothetical protein